MTYLKNNRDYSCSFKINKDGKQQEFVFDCRRIYTDTGNIATTGVTPIEDADFNWLYENVKQFKKLVDTGLFAKTKESGVTEVSNRLTSLEKENEVLKSELEKKTAEAAKASSEELDKAKEENASLKAQLEALKKKSSKTKETKKVDDTDGF